MHLSITVWVLDQIFSQYICRFSLVCFPYNTKLFSVSNYIVAFCTNFMCWYFREFLRSFHFCLLLTMYFMCFLSFFFCYFFYFFMYLYVYRYTDALCFIHTHMRIYLLVYRCCFKTQRKLYLCIAPSSWCIKCNDAWMM